ncbi:MAG: DUF2490 domain-containing protein [Candidatus Aceula meridiana]|nr:DUF2490 domain-containing protein [Candidatus Aceula meridiana]
MKKIIFTLSFVLICASLAFAYDDGDFQIWQTNNASWKISDNWKMSLEDEMWWGDNASDFYYNHTDLGIVYSGLAKWLDIGVNYRGIYSQSKNTWSYEHRPHFNLTLKTKIDDFDVSNRSRFEFRIGEKMEDKFRYRNKTTLRFPWKWTKFEIRPYIEDEIFIESESTEFTRNRIYTGVTFTIAGPVKGELFYMFQLAKSSSAEWNGTNVLGIKTKLSF